MRADAVGGPGVDALQGVGVVHADLSGTGKGVGLGGEDSFAACIEGDVTFEVEIVFRLETRQFLAVGEAPMHEKAAGAARDDEGARTVVRMPLDRMAARG